MADAGANRGEFALLLAELGLEAPCLALAGFVDRSGACVTLVARASISPASAERAAPCKVLASEPAADASATNVNPSSRPMS